MSTLMQGNIFEETADLVVIFGRGIGFNLLTGSWKDFSRQHPEFFGIQNPFTDTGRQPVTLASGQHFWFVPFSQGYDGITDQELEAALDTAFKWARQNGINHIATNGARNTDHENNIVSDALRARYLIGYARGAESQNDSLTVTLISLDDEFLRQGLPAD